MDRLDALFQRELQTRGVPATLDRSEQGGNLLRLRIQAIRPDDILDDIEEGLLVLNTRLELWEYVAPRERQIPSTSAITWRGPGEVKTTIVQESAYEGALSDLVRQAAQEFANAWLAANPR